MLKSYKRVFLMAWLRSSYLVPPEGGGDIHSSLLADWLNQISEAQDVCKYETYGFPEIVTTAHARVATKMNLAS